MRTIHGASEEIRTGKLSAGQLLQECLARIDKLEPTVRAWVLVDRERARAEAKQRDEELQRGQWRGPLHGIPLGVKDIFDVFDWPTACGSRLWQNSIARQDAPVVQQLRQAGAVLLGKTVTTQYASFDPPVTRNPWKLDRTPGGSSSGSAAAVASGMCLGALASQTGGSITRPASFCGVPGCKPTFNRVNAAGVLPLAHSMDHVGVIGRCSLDLALMLEVIASSGDRETGDAPSCSLSPKRPRLGRLHGLFDQRADPVMREAMDRACTRLRDQGATVADVSLPAAFAEVEPRHRIVMAVESAQYHEIRLLRHPEDYAPRIRGLVEEGLKCPAPEYARCKEHQRHLTAVMLHCFQSVDALITPATVGPAPDAGTTGDPVFNSPWSYVGYPTVSLPVELSPDGLPLSIQLVGKMFEEEHLLAVAGWCEEHLGWTPAEPQGVALG